MENIYYMKRLYECTFILRQDLATRDVDMLRDKFIGVLNQNDAKVLKTEYWRLRSLAYPIQKNKKGHYICLTVSASHKAVKELERQFTISEDILKWLFIKIDKFEEAPSPMMQEPIDSSSFNKIAEE